MSKKTAKVEELTATISVRGPDGLIYEFYDDRNDILRIGQYCSQDVEVETAIDNLILQHSARERRVWELDQLINERGVCLDLDMAQSAVDVVAVAGGRLHARMAEVTGGAVHKCSQVDRLADWINGQGVPCTSVAAPLQDDLILQAESILDPATAALIEEAISLRQQSGKGVPTTKYQTMLDCANADGKARGQLNYSGATTTGRWAGRLIQFQNMPSIDEDLDGANVRYATAILSAPGMSAEDRHEAIRMICGSVLPVLSKCLRHMLRASSGCRFIGGDLSNVEGCTSAWVADETWKIEAYREFQRTGDKTKDLYRVAFSRAFGTAIETITGAQRQVGKVLELACIAHDSLVLTDRGLVPIQDITLGHRVWDGFDWVRHEGLVDRGVRKTIRWSGLTATPDHLVWVEGNFGPIAFGDAARRGARLVSAEHGGSPIRVVDDCGRHEGMGGKVAPAEDQIETGTHRVYDIINAGPRNRFTVSGYLVHNCGFGGSIGALVRMMAKYKIKPAKMVAPVREMVTDGVWDAARERMRRPGTKTFGLSEDEWTAIRIAIDGWRAAHPNLVASWYSVGDAILDAMNNGELVNENGIRIRPAKVVWCLGNRVAYTYQRNVLWCRLPSGRTLAYHRPRVRTKVDVQVADPEGRLGWVEESEAPRLLAKGCSLTDQKPRYKHNVLYEGYDNTMKRWTTFDLHGALAYQNVVQSIARDVMVEGMFAAEAHAYPIVLTVHDELLCDVPIGHGSTEELQRLMATVPEWCPGLPLAAKTWEGYRYEK